VSQKVIINHTLHERKLTHINHIPEPEVLLTRLVVFLQVPGVVSDMWQVVNYRLQFPETLGVARSSFLTVELAKTPLDHIHDTQLANNSSSGSYQRHIYRIEHNLIKQRAN